MAAVLAAAVLGGCGLLGREPEETPQVLEARRVEDARIQAEVDARLAAEPSIGAARVRVQVERGEVQLFGGVAGLGALQCAVRNAELVPGVRLVIDHLVLERGPAQVQCLAPRVFGRAAG